MLFFGKKCTPILLARSLTSQNQTAQINFEQDKLFPSHFQNITLKNVNDLMLCSALKPGLHQINDIQTKCACGLLDFCRIWQTFAVTSDRPLTFKSLTIEGIMKFKQALFSPFS